MKRNIHKVFLILMSLILTLTFSGIPESELSAAAAGKASLASSSNTKHSYSVTKKSKTAKKKNSKAKKNSTKKKSTSKKTSSNTSSKSEAAQTPTTTAKPATSSAITANSLAKAYSDYFTMGVATPYYILCDSKTCSIVLKQFNTITMENETKPDALLDAAANCTHPDKYNTCPAIRTVDLENHLKFCQDNGIKLRFHTLVWYSQTPRWFFMKNYSTANNAKLVSKDIM